MLSSGRLNRERGSHLGDIAPNRGAFLLLLSPVSLENGLFLSLSASAENKHTPSRIIRMAESTVCMAFFSKLSGVWQK